jgi:HTH-type transcriptional regulator/antitoxin HigA
MITNERQYKITQACMKTYLEALERLKDLPPSRKQPWLRSAQRGDLEIQIEQLQEQLRQYEMLKSGKIKVPDPVDAVSRIALILTQSRIVRGWDQEELATRLGMAKQQIQRYEQNNYAQATLSVLSRIAAVLAQDTKPVAVSERKRKAISARSTNVSRAKTRKSASAGSTKRLAK